MTRRDHPPAWLFGIAAMPYGSFNGVVAVALPYALRGEGIPVERIAVIEALVQAPAIWYVLWAPIVDLKFRRRSWIVALSIGSGLCAAAAFGLTNLGAVRAATAIFVLASAIAQPVSSAVGGLVAAVMPASGRGRAAGWSQAGILGAGVVAGAVTVWLTDHGTALAGALAVLLLIIAPAFSALAIEERRPARTTVRAQLRRMVTEIRTVVGHRDLWLGMALFLSPAGAGALMNLFSSVAPDFHATSSDVLLVVGLAGVLTAAGALIAGFVLDRIDRWRAYPVAGLVTSLVVGGILLAPLSPATYLIGASLYALVTGFAYAAYMALALDLVGPEVVAGGTLFTLCTAAVNVPVVYMLRLDGLGHAHFGVRGMIGADGAANAIAGILLLVLLARFAGRRQRVGG